MLKFVIWILKNILVVMYYSIDIHKATYLPV